LEGNRAMLPKQLLHQLLDEEKLKYCFECGICTASCPMVELVPSRYNPRTLLQKIFLDSEGALKDEALWLCAWCYRCHKKCPQRLKLPEIFLSVRKIATERGYVEGLKSAYEVIGEEVPLPTVCTWVCFHPERAEVDRRLAEGYLRARARKTKAPPKRKEHKVKVAVVGSGPAGLTAAQELAQRGYVVTVFESSPHIGGMPRECIPRHRLPKTVLDSDLKRITDLEVEIKTGTPIGKDLAIQGLLQQGYRAVFVSVGAHKSRKLGVEGEDLEGVTHALDFLRRVNMDGRVRVGNRVAVIGGGNVAMDAARTARRLGAREVQILYRRSRDEMPANPWEVKETEGEGVKVQFLVAPKRVLGKDGRAAALECVIMSLGEPDETGRRSPLPIEGSEFQMEVDMVILAVGEAPDLSLLPKEVETNETNTVAVNPITMETSLPGVFAGGDCVSGPATIIEAIVAGKRAAAHMDEYLKNEVFKAERIAVQGRKKK